MTCSLLVLTLLAVSSAIASADVAKSCPDASEILISGVCQPRVVAKGDPVVATYHEALEALSGGKAKHALDLFDANCSKRNHGASCTQLGRMYDVGRGGVVPRNGPKAIALFEEACKRGDGAGCRLRGTADVNASNWTDQAKLKSARKFLELACDREEAFACALLGKLLEQAYGGAADPKRAVQLLDKATKVFGKRCPTGNQRIKRDGEVCWLLGHVLTQGWNKGVKDPVGARRAFELGCDANHGLACASLIEVVRASGKSLVDALDTYRKACRLEHASSCTTAAEHLTNSDHGKSTEPAELAKRACELDTVQCGLRGELYRLGWAGLPKDEFAATEHYKKACDAHSTSWCATYGARLLGGIGAKADPAAARPILERACNANQGAACNTLARSLVLTKTDADDATAYKLSQTGCGLKDANSCLLLAWQIEENRHGGPPVAEKADRIKVSIAKYEQVCTQGVAVGCTMAADRYFNGVGVDKDADKAMARYRAACDATEPSGDACLSVAVHLFEGKIVPKDVKGAFKGAARSCARNVEAACTWVGSSVVDPDDMKTVVAELTGACPRSEHACVATANVLLRGTTADKARANDLLAGSCARKHYAACIRASWALWAGDSGEADKAKAERMLGTHCSDGDGLSCVQAAIMARERKDGEALARFAGRGCTQLKHADSCVELAFMYYSGMKPIDANIEASITHATQACDLGSMLGCSNLALYNRFGIGVPRNPKRSFELYTKACEGGVSFACAGQARYLYTGEGGVKKDVAAGIETYRKACSDLVRPAPLGCVELADALETQPKIAASEISAFRDKGIKLVKKAAETNPNYMYFLGTFYRDGTAVAKDAAAARKWFVESCDRDDPLGCNGAGHLLASSENAADRDKAREYFGQACAAKMEDACKGLADLKKGPAPTTTKPTTPGVVKTKGHGCTTAPDAGLALILLALVGCRRRRHC